MSEVLKRDLYLHFSSIDVEKRFIPDNSISHFVVELPTTLHLHGKWEIAVLEFTCKFLSGIKYGDRLDILCDIIELSPVKSRWVLLLRSITFDRAVKIPDVLLDFRYVGIAHISIIRINFRLKLTSLKSSIDENSPTYFVLHLRKLNS